MKMRWRYQRWSSGSLSSCAVTESIGSWSTYLASHDGGTVHYSALLAPLQYRTVPYSTVPYRTVPYRTVHDSTVPCSAVQCSTVQCMTDVLDEQLRGELARALDELEHLGDVMCHMMRCDAMRCNAM